MNTHRLVILASIAASAALPLTAAEEPVDMARRARELQGLRWGMFICWSFSTFSGREWTGGVTDVNFFQATGCDTDQWARTAKEAGMGYILFLTKHHDGFCLWDTGTTDRKVTRAPLGRDVLAELRKSCDKHGIKLALYFSEGDWTWPGAVDGKGWKAGIGRNSAMKKAQLKELLTQYGPIEYLWFDHAAGDGGLSHAETIAFCKSLQPACFVGFNHGDQEGADIRLGEMGRPGPLHDHAAAGPHMRDAPSRNYRLAEFTYPILPSHKGGAKWFYSLPIHDNLCLSAEKLYRDYLGAVRYGNLFSIDVGPDYAGRLRKIDVETLRKVGEMIRSNAPLPEPVRAFCVDFNWGPGGPNGFAPPGLWADADPARHVAWYEALGANVIQTFAVSCNGYAWYRGGKIPAQPGLVHDFLPEVVKLGHAKKMRVMGYFCIGANTRWGAEHPELSYGTPSTYHLPFADEYLDYLGSAIEEALTRSGMDGFMVDWIWNPADKARKDNWLPAEKRLFEKLMGQPFPGEDKLTDEEQLAYERKAIDRCWERIRSTAKRIKPDCVIWLSCNEVEDPAIAGSRMLREVDWMMDESGSNEAMRRIAPMLGPQTRQLLCTVGWGDRHDARKICAGVAEDEYKYGIYGFARPDPDSLPLPIETYLNQPIESFKGNDRNIAVLAHLYNGKPLTASPQVPEITARPCWHKTPSLSIMTGFIYEPLKPYTIEQWMENLGNRFDADQWVKEFKETGASHLVFYDKWIDGLVFHDTKTTGFKTRRDFLRDLAPACRRAGLPLVIYFNAVSDGNPEFVEWSLLDRQGKPVVFGNRWPTRYQTLHSPFRSRCLEQVRELLGDYGPVHGIWHDIFRERLNTSSRWTASAYQKMFGKPFDQASPGRLVEFNARTLAGYLDEVEAIRREHGQQHCVYTANGSGSAFLDGGVWTEQVGTRLHYLFNEGHSFQKNEHLARIAWALPKSLDINLLLNETWFTPLEDMPPPAKYSVEQAIAATAVAVCQGAGVNFALTPGHNGKFGEDLEQARAVGAWYRKIQPWLEAAAPAAEVAVVHGPNANSVIEVLARAGVFSRLISPDQPLPDCRAIVVPAGSHMGEELDRYVYEGGTLIAFGEVGPLAGLFGVKPGGMVNFPKKIQGATAEADSEYNEQWAAAFALDEDLKTAWCSEGSPMPHWIEITMPEPVEVRTVEWVSRHGPYLVADAEVAVPEGNGWRVVESVRRAKNPKTAVALSAPVKTSRVRVNILRELYRGKDRQIADIAAIRVLDSSGRNRASAAFAPVRVTGAVECELPPSAMAVKPSTAEVLGRFDQPGKPPAVLRNKHGKGQAVLVTCSAASTNPMFWANLHRLTLGELPLVTAPEDSDRFRFIFTRTGEARTLHVVDAAVPAKDYHPKPVEISLASGLLGARRHAALAGEGKPIAVSAKDARLHFVIQPDPVATVVFECPKE